MIKQSYKQFKSGLKSVIGEFHSGLSSSATISDNIETMLIPVEEYRRLIVREEESNLGIPKLLF